MTNTEVHGAINEAYKVFRKYRDHRPLPSDLQPKAWDAFMDIINRYTRYPEEGTEPLNGWVMDTAVGLYRELEKEQ